MDFAGLFRKVPTVAAAELRARIEDGREKGTVLLDVRESAEYERGHIPGAVHVPLSRLADRLEELDPSRPVITY